MGWWRSQRLAPLWASQWRHAHMSLLASLGQAGNDMMPKPGAQEAWAWGFDRASRKTTSIAASLESEAAMKHIGAQVPPVVRWHVLSMDSGVGFSFPPANRWHVSRPFSHSPSTHHPADRKLCCSISRALRRGSAIKLRKCGDANPSVADGLSCLSPPANANGSGTQTLQPGPFARVLLASS